MNTQAIPKSPPTFSITAMCLTAVLSANATIIGMKVLDRFGTSSEAETKPGTTLVAAPTAATNGKHHDQTAEDDNIDISPVIGGLDESVWVIPPGTKTPEAAYLAMAKETQKLPSILVGDASKEPVYVYIDPLCQYSREYVRLLDQNIDTLAYSVRLVPMNAFDESYTVGLSYHLSDLVINQRNDDALKLLRSAVQEGIAPLLKTEFEYGEQAVYFVNRATIGMSQLEEAGTPTSIYRNSDKQIRITTGLPTLDELQGVLYAL